MWEEEAPPPPAPLPRPLLTEDKVARCHLRPGSASPLLLSPPPGCFSGWVLRKYFYSSPERGKFIENWKVKMWNKEEKLNCYLMMISTYILDFCENNRKFLKALLLWHTLDWTGTNKNTINLLVNKPREIFIKGSWNCNGAQVVDQAHLPPSVILNQLSYYDCRVDWIINFVKYRLETSFWFDMKYHQICRIKLKV